MEHSIKLEKVDFDTSLGKPVSNKVGQQNPTIDMRVPSKLQVRKAKLLISEVSFYKASSPPQT